MSSLLHFLRAPAAISSEGRHDDDLAILAQRGPIVWRPTADAGSCTLDRSGQNRLDDLGRFDAGQSLIEAQVANGEPLMIEAEQVQDRGVPVVEMYRILDDVVREVVRLAVNR